MTIDQRLEFLAKNIESLHETVFENTKQIAANSRQIADLAATSERHEREMERFRRAMRAGLQAWLGENGTEPRG